MCCSMCIGTNWPSQPGKMAAVKRTQKSIYVLLCHLFFLKSSMCRLAFLCNIMYHTVFVIKSHFEKCQHSVQGNLLALFDIKISQNDFTCIFTSTHESTNSDKFPRSSLQLTTCWDALCLASVFRPWTRKLKFLAPAAATRVHDDGYKSQSWNPYYNTTTITKKCTPASKQQPKTTRINCNMKNNEESSVAKLQCQFQGMLPVVYTPRMKVIHAFGGTFHVTEKVIYTFPLLLCYR